VTEEAFKLLHEPLTAAESTAAGRAAEVLASSLGLCVLSSEEQLQLPCIAPFIERLESMRYVCRAAVPGRTNEEHYRAFCELKEQEGGASFFAWHGSPFKNWPSIIATGLKVSVFVCFCERAFWLACLSVEGRVRKVMQGCDTDARLQCTFACFLCSTSRYKYTHTCSAAQ